MSTEYGLGMDLVAFEQSSKVSLGIVDIEETEYSAPMGYDDLNRVILNLIKVLSYISEDPETTLKRYNVDYTDEV